MKSMHVPHDHWSAFARGFAQQHEGWLVTLVRRRATADPATPPTSRDLLAVEQPLIALTVERSPDGEDLFVVVGDAPQRAVLRIPCAASLQLDLQDGAHKGLSMETTSGDVYRLCFRTAARPEELDDIP